MALLECRNVTKTFQNTTVLDNVSLTLEPGRIVGLLGRNGAGKTTLIKLINDLLTPTSGEILFEGKPIGPESKAHISFLPEHTYLDPGMKVRGTIKMYADFYADFNADKAYELLQDLQLKEDMYLSKMSKGMQEKLQLILVMSRAAKLYILDEPLGGVDPATRDYIMDTILNNFCEGASVLLSTHLIADIERILDDVLFIDNGRMVLQSPADELRAREGGSVDQAFRRMFKC